MFENMVNPQGPPRKTSLCEGACPDSGYKSVFSCENYLVALLKAAEFTTSNQVIRQFGWDLSRAPPASHNRRKRCIAILRSLVTEYDEAVPTYIQYQRTVIEGLERLLPSEILQYFKKLTGYTNKKFFGKKTELEEILESKSVLKRMMKNAGFLMKEPELNQLAGALKKGKEQFERQTEGAYLQALLDQKIAENKKDLKDKLGRDLNPQEERQLYVLPEELRQRYFISFSPTQCEDLSECEQAILSLQEFLQNKLQRGWKLPEQYEHEDELLTYAGWRVFLLETFYPEIPFADEFKQPFIRGERETLRRHIKLAEEMLDKVRVAASPDAPLEKGESDRLSLSPTQERREYNNLKLGLELLKKFLIIDDLLLKGHQRFYDEEFQLSQEHYYQAAQEIRSLSHQWNRTLTLPIFIETEPIIGAEESENFKWLANYSQSPENEMKTVLTTLNAREVTQRIGISIGQFWKSFEESNQPITANRKALTELTGISLSKGSFNPFVREKYEEIYLDNSETPQSKSNKIIGLLKQNGWTSKYFLEDFRPPPTPSPHWYINWGLGLIEPTMPESKFEDPRDYAFSALLNDRSAQVQNFTFETDFRMKGSIPFMGILVRWNEEERKGIPVGIGNFEPDGPWYLGIGDPLELPLKNIKARMIKFERDRKAQVYIQRIMEVWHYYKLIVTVVGQDVTATLIPKKTDPDRYSYDELNDWDYEEGIGFTKTVPQISQRGKVGPLVHCHHKNSIPTYRGFWLYDLGGAKGVLSDNTLMLPAKPKFMRKLFFDFSNPDHPRGEYGNRIEVPGKRGRENLLKNLACEYGEHNFIIQEELENPTYDLLNKGGKRNYLRYQAGDSFLLRENMRDLLDQFFSLLPHQYFFLLPICLGQVAQALGQYREARQFYRLVYHDGEKATNNAIVYPFLNRPIEVPVLERFHAQNYRDWANDLNQRNTQESTEKARRKFGQILQLFNAETCCLGDTTERYVQIADYLLSYRGSTDMRLLLHENLSQFVLQPETSVLAREVLGEAEKLFIGNNYSIENIHTLEKFIEEKRNTLPQWTFNYFNPPKEDLGERLENLEERNTEVFSTIETSRRFRWIAMSLPAPSLQP
ncbi:MAG: hypothetical protein NPIRA03_06920 [Nitrospirales bacterium]|nr:MAG: hypothetical protein NPIRA03_06920 [Nitrospirales bacterium]